MREICRIRFAALWLVVGCAAMHPSRVTPGKTISCADGSQRIAASCASVDQLKAQVLQLNAGIPKIGLGLSAQYESQALAQVASATQQLALELDAKCEQYNACVIDAETWLSAEERIRRHVQLVQALAAAPSAMLGDLLWSNAVPELAKERLQAHLQVQARTPGGAYRVHESGAPLRSGDEVRLVLRLNRAAHVYLVLSSPSQEFSVVFPTPAAEPRNPLLPDVTHWIPNPRSGVFALDDVVGLERLDLVVSIAPIEELEALLAARSGAQTADALRQTLTHVACEPAASEAEGSSESCRKNLNRGIVFKVQDSSSEPSVFPASEAAAVTSLVRAEPNDSRIVLHHDIVHQARARATVPAQPVAPPRRDSNGFLLGSVVRSSMGVQWSHEPAEGRAHAEAQPQSGVWGGRGARGLFGGQ